jgi:hypothetical protein
MLKRRLRPPFYGEGALVDTPWSNSDIPAMNVFVAVRPDSVPEAREYLVSLYQAADGGRWIAEADDLPIATEADSVDALIERVWAVAPEIAELNGHKGALNLRFIVHTRAA